MGVFWEKVMTMRKNGRAIKPVVPVTIEPQKKQTKKSKTAKEKKETAVIENDASSSTIAELGDSSDK